MSTLTANLGKGSNLTADMGKGADLTINIGIGSNLVAAMGPPGPAEEGYGTEYQAVYDAFPAKPDAAYSTIWNTMVAALVAGGWWTRFDVFHFRAVHTNAGGEAMINWKLPGTYNATAYNAPVHTAYEGLLYNGSNQYSNLNWIPSVNGVNYVNDSATMLMYIRTNVDTASRHGIFGAADLKQCAIIPRFGTTTYAMINNNTQSSVGGQADGSGLYINTRTAFAVHNVYRNKIPIMPGTVARIGVPTHSPYEGAHNNDDVAGGFRADQVAVHAYADGFTQADVDGVTDIIETCMDAMGKGVIP